MVDEQLRRSRATNWSFLYRLLARKCFPARIDTVSYCHKHTLFLKFMRNISPVRWMIPVNLSPAFDVNTVVRALFDQHSSSAVEPRGLTRILRYFEYTKDCVNVYYSRTPIVHGISLVSNSSYVFKWLPRSVPISTHVARYVKAGLYLNHFFVQNPKRDRMRRGTSCLRLCCSGIRFASLLVSTLFWIHQWGIGEYIKRECDREQFGHE